MDELKEIVINKKYDRIGFYTEVKLNGSVDIGLYIVGGRIILSRCINKTNIDNYEWTMLHSLLGELVKRKEILGYEQVEIFKTSNLYKNNDCLYINSDCKLVMLGFKENTVSTTCGDLIESLQQMTQSLSGGSKKSRKYKRKYRHSRVAYRSQV
jgi:hypothetical protein